jgi:hypothetical protein
MPITARSVLFKLSCIAALAVGTSLSAQAATLKENFNAAFPAWESGWFGKYSNATNYCAANYCLVNGVPVDPNDTVRGIAGSGLVLSSDGAWSSFPITINFDPAFGATIKAMSIDVAAYVDSTFSAWDAGGTLIYTKVLRVDSYKDIPTSHYQTLQFKSDNGVSSFSFSGPADGNTVIDNIAVKTTKQ